MKTMNKILTIGALGLSLNPMETKADLFKCTACPAGYKCDGYNKTQCPAGTYSSVNAASCTNCSSGYYSRGGASSCTLCGANKRSTGSDCVDCGYWEYSSAGSTSCTGLQYQIESTIAEVGGGKQKSGTLSPGFYLIVLGGGDGGQSGNDYYDSDDDFVEGWIVKYSKAGKGAQLKYMIKVTSNTSYTIAGGNNGESASTGGSFHHFGGSYQPAAGGGGGSWAQIGSTYYVAGGGGGSAGFYQGYGSRGGSGGSVGAGGGTGIYTCSGCGSDDDDSDDNGNVGGSSGNYKGDLDNGSGPSGGYTGGSISCGTQSTSIYGGRGGFISNSYCSEATGRLCWEEVNNYENLNDYSEWVVDMSHNCDIYITSGGWAGEFYIKDGENGRTSHTDNTGGRFADKLCKNCAKIYKIK